jgi:hypothetical protein
MTFNGLSLGEGLVGGKAANQPLSIQKNEKTCHSERSEESSIFYRTLVIQSIGSNWMQSFGNVYLYTPICLPCSVYGGIAKAWHYGAAIHQ